MRNAGDANSGCFSGMFRRFLCARNVPTHPSDSLTESIGAEFRTPKTEVKTRVPAAEPRPGVVARLMGLNSLPDTNWVPKQRAPDAVSRSRSVNFTDFLLDFDTSQTHHRRVRTSTSFREVPPFWNLQNDLSVVYMEDFDDKKGTESNLRKSESRLGEVEQGKEEQSDNVKKNTRQNRESTKKKENQANQNKISKLKDEPRRKIGENHSKNRKCSRSKDSVSVLQSYKQSVLTNGVAVNSTSNRRKPTIQKEACSGTKLKKTTKKKTLRHAAKKTEPESDLENSSPISVLDLDGVDFSDERSPLRMEVDLKKAHYSDDQMEEDAMKKRDSDPKDRGESDCYSELVGRICRLAENDMREENWNLKRAYGFEGFEELCMELERHVINALLVQALDDLV